MNLIQEIFPGRMQKKMECINRIIEAVQEIRIRVNAPVIIRSYGIEYYVTLRGQLSKQMWEGEVQTQKDLEDIVLHICHSSFYAYEEELKRGYITIAGGHRVGIAGQAVLDDAGKIRTMKNVFFLNVRIAHEVIGAGDRILPYLYKDGNIQNTLIISPPGFGKTTLLRDLIRQISDGNRNGQARNCSVLDERSELAGSCRGVPQMQIGKRSDVLDGCPKAIGMMMAIRSMGPQVVAVDELGTREDIEALFAVIRCGCSILATIHGDGLQEVKGKSFLHEVMNQKVFERYIIIRDKQHNVNIYNGEYAEICNSMK